MMAIMVMMMSIMIMLLMMVTNLIVVIMVMGEIISLTAKMVDKSCLKKSHGFGNLYNDDGRDVLLLMTKKVR